VAHRVGGQFVRHQHQVLDPAVGQAQRAAVRGDRRPQRHQAAASNRCSIPSGARPDALPSFCLCQLADITDDQLEPRKLIAAEGT
jgi:hypothetical protein